MRSQGEKVATGFSGTIRRFGIVVGAIAMVGSLCLIFHPMKIDFPLSQGPPREVVMVWQPSYGQLGILFFLLGSFLFFASLPRSTRIGLLGLFLTASSIGLAAGFHFNDYHAWWWNTHRFVVPWGIASAGIGGFLVTLGLTRHHRVPLWTTLPAFLVTVAVFVAVSAGGCCGYYNYENPGSNPYPYFSDYAGDYMFQGLAIAGFQFLVSLGLFVGFVAGLVLHRFRSFRKQAQNGDPNIRAQLPPDGHRTNL